ncbi:MAG TPA: molybdopterin-dependent oxidoreductase, partial [Desulfobacterales bacterium]|nr:molybdopterin-dependent oxidoreductase [Desulfobacterales bacterium]
AHRNGAKIVLVDPRPVNPSFEFIHVLVTSDDMGLWLNFLLKNMTETGIPEAPDPNTRKDLNGTGTEGLSHLWDPEQIKEVEMDLSRSLRPVIVCGTEIVPETVPSLAADCARHLKLMKKASGLFYLFSGANAFGAALISDNETSFEKILTGIETNTIRALVLVESDPFFNFPDRSRLEKAFEQLDVLVVLDYLDSRSVQDAGMFLPTMTLYETGGFFINQEGRAQKISAAFQGGRPISQVSGGGHPPRSFRDDIPGCEARPAWQALAELRDGTSEQQKREVYTDLMKWLVETHPMFSDLLPVDAFPDTGVRINPGYDTDASIERNRSVIPQSDSKTDNDMELITVEWTFGTEELCVRSPYLRQMEREPCLLLSEKDSAQLEISDGDRVAIRLDTGTIDVHTAVVENMAPGILVLPRHHRLDWQHLKALKVTLNKNRIFGMNEDTSC